MWTSYVKPFYGMSPLQIVALTAYGENRMGGKAGMQSVINVIQNRRLYPANEGYMDLNILTDTQSPYHAVCLKQYQFSIYNLGDVNRGILLRLATPEAFAAELPNNLSLRTAWALCEQLYAGTLTEITGGANHYFAAGIKLPVWAFTMVYRTTIAGQLFYASAPYISQNPQKYLPIASAAGVATPEAAFGGTPIPANPQALSVVVPSTIIGLI